MKHREDDGEVVDSIRNDGTIAHVCTVCQRIWVSREEPELQATERFQRLVPRDQWKLQLSVGRTRRVYGGLDTPAKGVTAARRRPLIEFRKAVWRALEEQPPKGGSD